jgi:hypothetical protein
MDLMDLMDLMDGAFAQAASRKPQASYVRTSAASELS